jgi:hypothetical protein
VIILDANVVPREAGLDGLEFVALLAVAAETGHVVALPSVALVECVARFERDLRERHAKLLESVVAINKLVVEKIAAPRLPILDLAVSYEERLRARLEVLPLPDGAGEEAMRREARREPPAKNGGTRDAAIWLSAVAAARAVTSDVYFVSKNSKDFGQDALPPKLQDDIASFSGRFSYLSTTTSVIEQLAEYREPPEAALITAQPALREVLTRDLEAEALQELPTLLEIRRDPEFDLWASEVRQLELVEAASVRRYRVGGLDLVTLRVTARYNRVLTRRSLEAPSENTGNRSWLMRLQRQISILVRLDGPAVTTTTIVTRSPTLMLSVMPSTEGYGSNQSNWHVELG